MTERKSLQPSQFELIYEYKPVQGQSKLLAIITIRINMLKFVLFCILCVLTLGILLLFTYWFKKLTYKMYYDNVKIQDATKVLIENHDNQIAIIEIKSKLLFDGRKEEIVYYFQNRYLKYKIEEGKAFALGFNYQIDRINEASHDNFHGWTEQQATKLLETYGPGAMLINRLTPCQIFAGQFFKPLYMFLLVSIYLNYLNNYMLFVWFIILSCVIGIALTIIEMMDVNEKIFEMSYYQIFLNVLRSGKILKISSSCIVPGDIVFLNEQVKLPFEAVILEGQLLMNQCVLTGQSVPVMKIGQTSAKQTSINKNSYIYQGTTIVQINKKKKMKVWQKYKQEFGTPVCVVRSNFTTLKGQLIRKILFPVELQNKFQKQSYKAIAFLFVMTFVSFAFLAYRMSGVIPTLIIIKKGLDLITIVIPPTIPVSMTIGIIYAMKHMKKKNIFTIAPNRIVDGGMLNQLCFDKTGTLTHDFMQFKTLITCTKAIFDQPIHVSEHSKDSIATMTDNMKMVIANMASNHTVILLQESKQYAGDPMEIKLLEFSQCSIFNDENDVQAIFNFKGLNLNGRILQRFEFESQLQRMSVIVQLSDMKFYIFTKGSPEIMATIMKKQSIPNNYNQKMKEFASSGYRLLSIASRQISKNYKDYPRSIFEKDLHFDGFQIFQNGLKDETVGAILQLRRVNIEPVIITGDNPLTAANIGYQSAILDTNTKTLIINYEKGSFTEQQFIYRNDKNTNYNFNKTNFAKESDASNVNDPQLVFIKNLIEKVKKERYNICMTGNAFNKLYDKEFQLQNHMVPLKGELLEYIKIYARTKPYDKSNIVKGYQFIGKIVGMCGDGANDCAALNQANIGLSLSDTQASIAASFTSKERHIGSMVELIKECRGGLITNYSLFNIVITYVLVQYVSTIICQYFFAYPTNYIFVYWDLCLNLAFVSLLGNIGTADRLSKEAPPSTLFNFENLLSLLIFHVLQFSTQILTIFLISGPMQDTIDYYSNGGEIVNQRRYLQKVNQSNFLTDTPQTNVLFIVGNFMYMHSIFANTRCLTWKKPIYSYWLLNIVFVVLYAYNVCLAVVPSLRLTGFKLTYLTSDQLNWTLLAIAIGMGLFTNMAHQVIITVFRWRRQSKENDFQEQNIKS